MTFLQKLKLAMGRPVVLFDYGQSPPRCGTPNNVGAHSKVFIHYSASDGEGIDKAGEPIEAVRNIQDYHQDVKGWCDTAYSYLIVQPRGFLKRARIFKGRGFSQVPASQEGSNAGNVSICVVADSNDRISRSTYRAMAFLVRRCPARRVFGHKDVTATSCPGPHLYSKVPHLNRAARKRKARYLP